MYCANCVVQAVLAARLEWIENLECFPFKDKNVEQTIAHEWERVLACKSKLCDIRVAMILSLAGLLAVFEKRFFPFRNAINYFAELLATHTTFIQRKNFREHTM